MDKPEPTPGIDQALLAARDQANRNFVAAWQRWRGAERLLPKRSAVEVGDIKQLLGRVILFELIGDDEILVKVAGSQLREHASFEATGRNLRDLTPGEQWPVRRWRMKAAAAQPCGAWMVNGHQNAQRRGRRLRDRNAPRRARRVREAPAPHEQRGGAGRCL